MFRAARKTTVSAEHPAKNAAVMQNASSRGRALVKFFMFFCASLIPVVSFRASVSLCPIITEMRAGGKREAEKRRKIDPK